MIGSVACTKPAALDVAANALFSPAALAHPPFCQAPSDLQGLGNSVTLDSVDANNIGVQIVWRYDLSSSSPIEVLRNTWSRSRSGGPGGLSTRKWTPYIQRIGAASRDVAFVAWQGKTSPPGVCMAVGSPLQMALDASAAPSVLQASCQTCLWMGMKQCAMPRTHLHSKNGDHLHCPACAGFRDGRSFDGQVDAWSGGVWRTIREAQEGVSTLQLVGLAPNQLWAVRPSSLVFFDGARWTDYVRANMSFSDFFALLFCYLILSGGGLEPVCSMRHCVGGGHAAALPSVPPTNASIKARVLSALCAVPCSWPDRWGIGM